jgi:two-component sensor histidine kinase
VQAIANQTLRGSTNLQQANEALVGRLASLAQAHDILTNENWSGADLHEVVIGALRPHVEIARLEIAGQPVRLRPSLALSLAMAFHELATNAIKYGALSDASGSVSISWAVEGGEGMQRLRIKWQERGGPPVKASLHRGFGSRMLKRVLSSEPGGNIEIRFEQSGLVCILEAQLRAPERVEVAPASAHSNVA